MPGTISIDDWAKKIEEIGAEEFARRLTVALAETALEMESAAKSNATGSPAVRTGRLRSSIRASVVDGSGGPEIHLQAGGANNLQYARMQEFGGTVTPTAGDWLRIPLSNARTAAGVDRFSGGLRALAPGEFFSFMSRSGDLFLSKRDNPEMGPWYKLVREVEITGSHYLGRALESAQGALQLRMADVWRVSLGGV